MSLRIGLKGGDLFLRHLKLEEELDRLGDAERVAVVEAARLHNGCTGHCVGTWTSARPQSYAAHSATS